MSVQQIHQYHANVERVIRYSGARNASALRKCFHDLLQAYATSKNLLLVPEVEVRTSAEAGVWNCSSPPWGTGTQERRREHTGGRFRK